MERGWVEAAVMVDPSASRLQKYLGKEKVTILTGTRTERGVREDFGVPTYPATVLYSSRDWIEENDRQVRGLAAAIVRALKFIDTHFAKEIAAKMPSQYAGDDPDVYMTAIQSAKNVYAKAGRIQADGAAAVSKVLARFALEVASADVVLSKTYTSTCPEQSTGTKGTRPTETGRCNCTRPFGTRRDQGSVLPDRGRSGDRSARGGRDRPRGGGRGQTLASRH